MNRPFRGCASRLSPPRRWLRSLAGGLALLCLGGCVALPSAPPQARLSRGQPVLIDTTAYCPCGKCCGWKRNWLFRPVVAAGPDRGKPKAVGITASGKRAHPGTLAADTRYYPMGTVIYVPGYGYGVVEDRGGGIQGRQRLDLFCRTHAEALAWGRRRVQAVVFPPGTPAVPVKASPRR